MSCPYIASLEFLFYNVIIEVKIKTVCLPITDVIRNYTNYMYLVWLLRNRMDINIFRLYKRFFNV